MTHRFTDHDGTCCPVPRGTLIEAEFRNGERDRWICGTIMIDPVLDGRGWYWAHDLLVDLGPKPFDILRYRIVKPRGLTILESILAKVGEKETASLSGGDKPEHLPSETAPGVQAASGGFSGVV